MNNKKIFFIIVKVSVSNKLFQKNRGNLGLQEIRTSKERPELRKLVDYWFIFSLRMITYISMNQ